MAVASAIGTDDRLVQRARQGDADAFERIVHLHFPRVFRIALAILGDDADARDAVQETFLRAWRDAPRLREVDRFDAWLARIAVNTARTMLRHRRRRVRELRVDPWPDEGLDVLDPGVGHDDRAADLDVLERAFERLGADQRTLLVLHHAEHLPLGRIAASMGIPEKTVKSRLFAARRGLEAALREELR